MITCKPALSERDQDLVVQTAAPEFADQKQLKRLMREDPSFRKGLTSDPKLFQLVTSREPMSLGISLNLFFEVLLRKTVADLEVATHTLERSVTQRLPVFDAKAVSELLKEEDVFYYLVHLLASFARCKPGTIDDADIDRLNELCKTADETNQFLIRKRIADVCLFVLGVFPEYLMQDYVFLFSRKGPSFGGELRRGVTEYETLGSQFYDLAAKHDIAQASGLRSVLFALSERLTLAKKPLNHVSAHYLALTQPPSPS